MKTRPHNPFLSIATILLCITCLSCSRPHHVREPIRTPPVERWPAEILAAANIIRTSVVNEEREDAGDTIERFLWQCSKNTNTSEAASWQPLKIETAHNLLGPQAAGSLMSDGSLIYILGHYYAVESLLLLQQEDGLVVSVCIGQGDTAPCNKHDHASEKTKETEQEN